MSRSRQQTMIKKTKLSNLRIIAGSMRGRKISFIATEGLRPTLDQVRETLFNWLMPDIAESNCLDLFAGSGALGFEAISRGVKFVTMVESNKQVADYLKQNMQQLKISNAKVHLSTAANFLSSNVEKFDIIFLDPPFEKGLLNLTLEKIKPFLQDEAKVYIEHEKNHQLTPIGNEWQQLKSKTTSRFCYSLLTLKQ